MKPITIYTPPQHGSNSQVLVNAVTGEVGPGTQVTGNATYQALELPSAHSLSHNSERTRVLCLLRWTLRVVVEYLRMQAPKEELHIKFWMLEAQI